MRQELRLRFGALGVPFLEIAWGMGRFLIAVLWAADTDRTAEMRREASMIPQRWETPAGISTGGAATDCSGRTGTSTASGENIRSILGASARYSGFPTRKARGCGVAVPRTSSQNLSRPSSFSGLISTRLYRSARHQERASLMSQAQSTSTPSLRMASARSSRFTGEASISNTRFFLISPGIGLDSGSVRKDNVMPASAASVRQDCLKL